MEPLRSIIESYRNITKHYRRLWKCRGGTAECCGVLQKRYETLWNVTDPLRNVAEHYGALRVVTERYRSFADDYIMLQEPYGAVTLCYGTVTENINFDNMAQNANDIMASPV